MPASTVIEEARFIEAIDISSVMDLLSSVLQESLRFQQALA